MIWGLFNNHLLLSRIARVGGWLIVLALALKGSTTIHPTWLGSALLLGGLLLFGAAQIERDLAAP